MEKKSRNLSFLGSFIFAMVVVSFFLPSKGYSTETYRFERMWPDLQQPWYFDSPTGVAFDADDNLYVAEEGNDRIQKFRPDGTLVTKWGFSGSGNGQFYNPSGIAIDKNGYVYVCENSSCRIQKFTANGEYILKWGSYGSFNGQFKGPVGIAVDDDGYVYVADTGNDRIQKFSSSGHFIDAWEVSVPDEEEAESPEGVAIDIEGNLIVGIYNGIAKFSTDGVFISLNRREWGEDGYFYGTPSGLAVDKSGNIYVTGPDSIMKFSPQGEYLGEWDGSDSGEGSLYFPAGVALDSQGNTYATAYTGDAVWKFNSFGQFISRWGNGGIGEGEFEEPESIAGSGTGNVYVTDKSANKRIQKFDPNCGFLWQMENPAGSSLIGSITSDANDDLYVLSDEVFKYDSTGAFLRRWQSGDGEDFTFSDAIVADSFGDIYVAFDSPDKTHKFDSNGNFIENWPQVGDELAADSVGNVYLYGSAEIIKCSAAGVVLEVWDDDHTGGPYLPYSVGGMSIDSEGSVYVVDSGNHCVQKLSAEGKYMTSFGEYGTEPGQLKNPKGIWVSPDGKVYVVDSGNRRVQVFSTKEEPGEPMENAKAVIVAGSGPYESNNLWEATEMCANFAYRALMHQGFDKDSIYYLSARTNLDLDGNGLADDVDAVADNDNFHYALLEWASDADELFVYMTGHGGNGVFRMGETETLTAADLDSWLDSLQETGPEKIALLYDACSSGSFLPLLKPASGRERLLTSSASSDQEALFCTQGTLSFSFFFWSRFFNGDSFYTSFVHASHGIGLLWDQTPEIDGDGNGIGNEKIDKEIAGQWIVGNETITAGDIPAIGDASPPQLLEEGEASCLIYAENVVDADGIVRVWAAISPPYYDSDSADEPITDLPTIDLEPVGNCYQATYEVFTERGEYGITIFAIDSKATISLPASTTVTVPQCPNHPVKVGELYYDSLSDALSECAGGETVQCRRFDFYENLELAMPMVLSGGFDCYFEENGFKRGGTTIDGSLTITGGPVEIENVVLR